ncbi:MAG: ApbE family, partial [Pseudomonadota bacterium]
ALATSSANGFRFADGSSHILHPLKRRPPVWASATVIAPEAAIADALSTALVLAEGPQLGQQLVAQAKASRILLEDLSGHAFWI